MKNFWFLAEHFWIILSNNERILNFKNLCQKFFKSSFRLSIIVIMVFFDVFSFFLYVIIFYFSQCCNPKTSSLPRTIDNAIQFFLARRRILLLLRRKVQTVVVLLSSMPFSKSIDRVYTRPLLVPRYYRAYVPLRIVLRFAFLPDRDQSCQHCLTILIAYRTLTIFVSQYA